MARPLGIGCKHFDGLVFAVCNHIAIGSKHSNIDELTEQLIYDDVNVPKNTDADERLEARTTVKVFRRDTKPVEDNTDTKEAQEYVIPNGYTQSKRNRAFSSKHTKESLLLPSDYDIPVIEHLKIFIKSLIGGKDA